jgi:hypothetical protein
MGAAEAVVKDAGNPAATTRDYHRGANRGRIVRQKLDTINAR